MKHPLKPCAELAASDPGYPEMMQHRSRGKCRRRKILIAAATLAVLGGTGYAGYALVQHLRRPPIVDMLGFYDGPIQPLPAPPEP